MLHGLSLGIPANDNPCVVHQLGWPAREKISLDTSEFVFRSGIAWSPDILKFDAGRSAGTDTSGALLDSGLDDASGDVLRDVPASGPPETEPGWAKRSGWSPQREMMLGAALIGLDFVFHGQRAWSEGWKAEHSLAVTGMGSGPLGWLAPRPEQEIATALIDTSVDAAAAVTVSLGHAISQGSRLAKGEATAHAEPEQVSAPTAAKASAGGPTEGVGDAGGPVVVPTKSTSAVSERVLSVSGGPTPRSGAARLVA